MSRRNFFSLSNSLYEFFLRPWHEYFLGLIGVHEFFSCNFPSREYFFLLQPPPPHPHKFSNGLSLNHTDTDQFAYLSVIVRESVLGAKSCGQPIWLKLGTEVGCDKIFQKPLWLTSLTFSFGVTGGGVSFFPF